MANLSEWESKEVGWRYGETVLYVYFLKAWGECPLIKIGRSRDPVARVRELQTGCPFKLKLLGSVRCKNEAHSKQVERKAHEMFHKQRKRGEWFRLSGAQERAIRSVIEIASREQQAADSAEASTKEMDAAFASRMADAN